MVATAIVGYYVTLAKERDYFCTTPACLKWMHDHWVRDGAIIEPLTDERISELVADRDGHHIYCECGTALSHPSC